MARGHVPLHVSTHTDRHIFIECVELEEREREKETQVECVECPRSAWEYVGRPMGRVTVYAVAAAAAVTIYNTLCCVPFSFSVYIQLHVLCVYSKSMIGREGMRPRQSQWPCA